MAAATTAVDVCPLNASPCNVTTDVTVSDGSALDFGTRALVVKRNKHLDVGGGTMTINAGSVEVEAGAGIQGISTSVGGVIHINTTGGVHVAVDGTTQGHVDVSATFSAGEVHITAGGDVVIDGSLAATALDINGDGGTLEVTAGGKITLNGETSVASGAQGGAGSMTFTAGGPITATKPVNAAGGEYDGGDIDFESTAGDIVTTASLAKIDVSGGGYSGSGGSVTLAGQNVTLVGQILGRGEGNIEEGGGAGAEVDISADQKVTLGDQIIVPGPGPDGDAGLVDVLAGTDAVQMAPIEAGAVGIDTCGGDVDIEADRDVTLNAIDVTAGSCGDGSVYASAGRTLLAGYRIDADGSATGSGGSVTLIGENLTLANNIHASGGGGGGFVNLMGCTVNFNSGYQITTLGTDGKNLFQASGQMTIRGSASAGSSNRLEYRTTAPQILGGTFSPAAQIVQNPDLRPCQQIQAVCGDGNVDAGEECDDHNITACDGCSATCRLEGCGNGVIECDEECDDGPLNGSFGDLCDATCHATVVTLRFFPGGPKTRGCLLEWAVVNPNSKVVKGFPARLQQCLDGDPACDADGDNDGVCTFTVSACLNVTDSRLPDCMSPGVKSAKLRRPSPLRPSDDVEREDGTRLADALKAFGITVQSGSTTLQSGSPDARHDHCSPGLALRVPHNPGRIGRRSLAAGAVDPTDHSMRGNRVRFACLPNPAVCGNGVLEPPGEQCDDGNTRSCDGCSDKCHKEVCGNGIIECNEQCDDGPNNGRPGNPCSASCTEVPPPLRIPGGGPPKTDCAAEWALAIGQPLLDRKGLPSTKQTCVDNDPSCDFDPTPGQCRFRIWSCLGGTESRFDCIPSAAEGVDVVRPSATQTGPPAALRQAMVAAFDRLTFPVGSGEVCTSRINVDLPVGRRRFVLRTRTHRSDGPSDNDVLQLLCAAPPAP
jgi:cysteine-rich repeat protein